MPWRRKVAWKQLKGDLIVTSMTLVCEDLSVLPPAEYSKRIAELLRVACPGRLDEPYFKQRMKEAAAMGLTWIEGVQYVIQRRRELN